MRKQNQESIDAATAEVKKEEKMEKIKIARETAEKIDAMTFGKEQDNSRPWIAQVKDIVLAALGSETPVPREVVSEETGAALITKERDRQIGDEGWTHSHDAKHNEGQLAFAACCYAHIAGCLNNGSDLDRSYSGQPGLRFHYLSRTPFNAPLWPWERQWWKPSTDPIRNLVKAGALIAAEIDRLRAASQSALPQAPTDTGGRTEHGKGGANVYTPVTPAAPSRKQEEEALIKKYAAYICDGVKGPTTVGQILHRFLGAAARVEPTKEEENL